MAVVDGGWRWLTVGGGVLLWVAVVHGGWRCFAVGGGS